MCSIFGSLNFDFDPLTVFDLMRGRGPDFEDVKKVNNWKLAHQRLAILGLTPEGNQPMFRDGNVIVFNGEIYNYKELRSQYCADDVFRSGSDTEVLLCLLNKYGMKILNKLNGMFAFAYYDVKSGKTYLVRDRYGVKPCYYQKKGNSFIFSSNAIPILKARGEKYEFDEAYVEKFFVDTATDFDEHTLIKDIYQVRPGEYLEISENADFSRHKWYQGDDAGYMKSDFKDYSTMVNNFEEIFTSAVEVRNRSDVDVGITLSGGLDSSLIYILSKEKLGADYKVFSFANKDENVNEFGIAKRLADFYGDEITKVQDVEQSWDSYEKSIKALEYPIWGFSHIGFYNVYNAIGKSGCKVILEGHGSDELLGGWPFTLASACRQEIGNYHLKSASDIFKVREQTFNKNLRQGCTKASLTAFLKEVWTVLGAKNKGKNREFNYLLTHIFDYMILPISLRCFERLTSINSVESRAPFMDYRVVEYLRRVPVSSKVNKIGSKAILREIIKKYNKEYVYQNKTKLGFMSSELDFVNNGINYQKMLPYLNSSCYKYKIGDGQILDKFANHELQYGFDNNLYKVISLEILKKTI